MSSKYLSETGIKGLIKTGSIIVPGDDIFPSFSKTSFHKQIDRMLDYMEEEDRDGVCLLMSIFYYTPSFLISALLKLTDHNQKFPNLIGAPLRLILIGVKGMIFTLYYSNLEDPNEYGQKIHDLIGWDAKIVRDEQSDQKTRERKMKSVNEVFESARKSLTPLRNLSVKQRVNFVSSLRNIILRRKEEIISRIQQDTKKSKSDALISEIFGVLDFLEFLETQAPKSLKDEKVKTPIALMGKKSRIFYEPMGVVLIISPWNYPFYQAIVPIMNAFVCGNAVIYKPSEFTPLTGLVEELLEEAGMNSDWVQIVYGDGKVGSELIDQRPDKIFFTGSVATGKKIMEQAAKQIIPVELELGGKDPMIVFEDANLTRAARGALWGALTNCGQSCTSVERIYVHESIYDEFRDEIVNVAKTIKQSTDSDGDSDIGGMTTPAQIEIVKDHLQDAIDKGATLLHGSNWDKQSEMIPPLVFDNVTNEMKIIKEETFGPIVPLVKFYDEAEAIQLANDSEFGLSASVWSADKKRAERVARALVTGNVSINNVMLTEGNPYLPFGGTKLSGIGRYKGVMGLHAFCNIKSVLIDADSNKIEANWYPYTTKKYDIFSKLTDNAFTHGVVAFIKFAITGLRLEMYSDKAGKKGRA